MHLLVLFIGIVLGVVEPVATGQSAKDYLTRAVNPTLLSGLTELAKMKPKDPIVSISQRFIQAMISC